MFPYAANFSAVLALIFLVIAYFKRNNDITRENLKTVLDGLLRVENSAEIGNGLRVAVGFGSCVDLIVPALGLFEKIEADIPDHVEHFHSIGNVHELEQMFAYFFRHGAAAERFVTNETLFKSLVSAAKRHPNSKSFVGGNAPVMLKNFQKLGFEVLLGAQMTENLRTLIGKDIKVAGNIVDEDDIHLIMEYNKGDTFGEFISPRANRFIVHNDHNNPLLSSLEKFAENLITFQPHLIVVGGLQMMDNYPFLPNQRKMRLNKLAEVLSELDEKTHVHFEMAHFTEQGCLEDIMDTVAYHSDSLGMNEQELPNLLGLLTNGSITLVSDSTPRIAATLDQMRLLFELLKKRADSAHYLLSSNGDKHEQAPQRKRSLTRLHVHTLAFQAIMTESSSSWKNSKQASARAALTANRHTCGNHQVQIDTSRLIMDDSFATAQKEGALRLRVDPSEPVTCWKEGEYDICLAPVIVCTKVVQTVGGGDNISSSGLVVQI